MGTTERWANNHGRTPTMTLSNGKVYALSEDYPGEVDHGYIAIERIPSVKTVRHFFDHSTMRQPEAVYPVDPALRCVGEVVEDEWEIVQYHEDCPEAPR
jgi:hypothetical protein